MFLETEKRWRQTFVYLSIGLLIKSRQVSVCSPQQNNNKFLQPISSSFFLLLPHAGRCVARIFHGLQSPRYPALDWYKSNFWGRYTTVDFYVIKNMATKALIEVKTKKSQVQ